MYKNIIINNYDSIQLASNKKSSGGQDGGELEEEIAELEEALSAKDEELGEMMEKYNDTIVQNKALSKRIGNLEAKLGTNGC